eukprot:2105082-Prymnesium_polylepis.1
MIWLMHAKRVRAPKETDGMRKNFVRPGSTREGEWPGGGAHRSEQLGAARVRGQPADIPSSPGGTTGVQLVAAHVTPWVARARDGARAC